MKFAKSTPILFFLIFSYIVSAQPESQLLFNWEKFHGEKGTERITDIIQSYNGFIVAVGSTTSDTEGGEDGLLLILDKEDGTKILEKTFGGEQNEGFNAVVQNFDGSFTLGGYKETDAKGPMDGWIAVVDDRGTLLWQTTMGDLGKDEVRSLTVLEDGGIVAAGYRNSRKLNDLWLFKILNRKVDWEFAIGKKNAGAVSRHGGHF